MSGQVVDDGAVTRSDLDAWEAEFENVCARFEARFYRPESRRHFRQYMRGLLAPLERKNGWTIAEFTGESEPKAIQRFLNLTPRDADALRDDVRSYAMERIADPRGVLIADPTGFAEKGKKSAGVQRQYSGTLGRIDNCQIGTFLAYVNTMGDRVLLDRELSIPAKSWFGDPGRCAGAGVPADLTFATRPQQVEAMIGRVLAARVPFAWFAADEEFGQNPGLRAYVEGQQIAYVMAVPRDTGVHRRLRPQDRLLRPRRAPAAECLAAPLPRNRIERIPRSRLGARQRRRSPSPVHDPPLHGNRGTRLLPLLQPPRRKLRAARPGRRRTLAHRGMLRGIERRGRTRSLPGPPLRRLVPAYHPGDARPHIPCRPGTPGQQRAPPPAGNFLSLKPRTPQMVP